MRQKLRNTNFTLGKPIGLLLGLHSTQTLWILHFLLGSIDIDTIEGLVSYAVPTLPKIVFCSQFCFYAFLTQRSSNVAPNLKIR